jgi:hypothetical protein
MWYAIHTHPSPPGKVSQVRREGLRQNSLPFKGRARVGMGLHPSPVTRRSPLTLKYPSELTKW